MRRAVCTFACFGSRRASTPPPQIRLLLRCAIHPRMRLAWLGRKAPLALQRRLAASGAPQRRICSGPVAGAPRPRSLMALAVSLRRKRSACAYRCHRCAMLCNGSCKAQAEACAAKRESGYATNSAGGRGASAAGPEIPKEAGPRRRAQRRGAGDAGGIPTRSMRPHRRADARPYAERGIAGGAGMRRSAANAPRATAGNAGKQGGRRADGGAAVKNSPPKAIFRLPSATRARRMRRKLRAYTPPGIFRRFAGTERGTGDGARHKKAILI